MYFGHDQSGLSMSMSTSATVTLLPQRKQYGKRLSICKKSRKKHQRLFLRISKGQCCRKYRAPEYYAKKWPLEDENTSN